MDDTSSTPPEVTIDPADNGYIVRHYQRSAKKDESGRTIRRVATTADEALAHARTALGGSGKTKSTRKKSLRDGQSGIADAGDGSGASTSTSSPLARSVNKSARGSARRRRPRVGGRR